MDGYIQNFLESILRKVKKKIHQKLYFDLSSHTEHEKPSMNNSK